jgi:ABC-2 type transport system ATP-binding protein
VPAADLVVEVCGVTKWFGEQTALDRVDLSVARGSVHGLLGANGAGKTTLLAAVFGLVLPDEGVVRLFGRTRGEARGEWLHAVGGFVETPRFYPYLSGRQNLAGLARLDRGQGAARIDELLAVVGLREADQKVRGYSLGMRQRLGIASALLREPRLLVLDEPTNGLDPAAVRDLVGALRRMADGGLTVLLSSHDVAQIETVCDDVTILRNGTVAFDSHVHPLRAFARDVGWRLSTSDDAAAAIIAARVAGLTIRRQVDGLLVLSSQSRLDDYMVALGQAGIAVRGLAAELTPLQALFFDLTDESTEPPDPIRHPVLS